jgi:hypothetical protein
LNHFLSWMSFYRFFTNSFLNLESKFHFLGGWLMTWFHILCFDPCFHLLLYIYRRSSRSLWLFSYLSIFFLFLRELLKYWIFCIICIFSRRIFEFEEIFLPFVRHKLVWK